MIFGAHPELGVVRPVYHNRIGRAKVTVTDPAFFGLAQGSLVHLAFLSALRQAVGASLEDWEIPKEVSETIPDALWHRPEGTFAVEVDLGYPLSLVARKAEAYRSYAGQVWGVASPERERQVYLEVRRRNPLQPLEVIRLPVGRAFSSGALPGGKGLVFILAFALLCAFGVGFSRSSSGYTVVYQRAKPSPSPSYQVSPSQPLPAQGPTKTGGAPLEAPDLFSQFFEATPPTEEGQESFGDSLEPGLFFRAKLVSGLMAPIGMSTPVLAQAEEGWCGKAKCQELYLLGTASLLPTGRSAISFGLALLREGSRVSAKRADAVAFDAKDLMYGVKGQVMDVAPALAADLVRAALGGLTDWVDAMLKASTVVTDARGRTTVTTEAPPVWATMLGRVGQVVDVPQNTTALVRAVTASAGEEVMVLTGISRIGGGR